MNWQQHWFETAEEAEAFLDSPNFANDERSYYYGRCYKPTPLDDMKSLIEEAEKQK